MEIIRTMLKLWFKKTLIRDLLWVSQPTIDRVERWEKIVNSKRIKAINWRTHELIDKLTKAHYEDII